MEEILIRLGIKPNQNIYTIKDELEQKQLQLIKQLDVIQHRANKTLHDEELEKQLERDIDDIEKALKLISWTIKRISTGLTRTKTGTPEDQSAETSIGGEEEHRKPSDENTYQSPSDDINLIINTAWKYLENTDGERNYSKAYELFQKVVKLGGSRGKAGIARMYLEGLGVEKDEKKALSLANEAADMGDSYGQCMIGEIYENGHYVVKDPSYAAIWYWKSAQQGYARAQAKLGDLYMKGRGVPKDLSEAKYWIRLSAEQKNALGEFFLGQFYELEENSNNRANSKSMEYYERAANHGHAAAQAIIGRQYLRSSNIEKAKELFQKAADQEDPMGQFLLGRMYEEGLGVNKDTSKAIEYYKQSADKGYSDAQYCLSVAYQDGIGINKDLTEAVKYCKKAAEQDHVQAQSNLGYLYYTGNGVSLNYAEAVKWLKLSAMKGDKVAQCSLGTAYWEGNGVEQNNAEALVWIKKSAAQSYAAAEYSLGIIYRNGRGVNIDIDEAEKWHKKAAAQHFDLAYLELAEIYGHDYLGKKNLMEAYRCFKKAGHSNRYKMEQFLDKRAESKNIDDFVFIKRIADEENDLYACKCLGDMYFYGHGTMKNYRESFRYYKKAEQGKLTGVRFERIFERVDAAITMEMTYQEAMKMLNTSSFQKGIEVLRRLSDQGYADAQFEMGKLYMEGYRIPKNIDAAKRMFDKAKTNGHPEADQYVKELYGKH
ncbi:MAG: cobalamin biosynthesis protein CobT [Herbinix sp.]|jgi:TPR repeat protein|nr:cobalamin biosynthesis protein CobT [Herbinix sp.]